MGFGGWLGRQGIQHVVALPGAGPDGPGGVRTVAAPDPDSGWALAAAEGTMRSGLAAVWDGEVLTFVSRPVDPLAPPVPLPARSIDEVATALEHARAAGAGVLAVRPEFDVTAGGSTTDGPMAAPRGAPRGAGSDRGELRRDPSLAARVAGASWAAAPAGTVPVDLMLAGRGVLRAGAVPALNRFAERTGLGVLNAYTAKGVFRWDSPYHVGTGFLQRRDLALAAGRPNPVLLTVGLDADECLPEVFAAAGVDPAGTWRIEPDELDGIGVDVGAGVGWPCARVNATESGRSPLYRDLSAMMNPLYAADTVPPNPARVSADLAASLPANGTVWAEPGRAGLWVGRSVPTTRLGSVRVPAAGTPGLAVAGALSAALFDGGVGVAVVDALTPAAQAGLDWAASLGVTLVVEVWGERGEAYSSAEHGRRLAEAVATPGVSVLELAVDTAAPTAALIDAAGPVVAWS